MCFLLAPSAEYFSYCSDRIPERTCPYAINYNNYVEKKKKKRTEFSRRPQLTENV